MIHLINVISNCYGASVTTNLDMTNALGNVYIEPEESSLPKKVLLTFLKFQKLEKGG